MLENVKNISARNTQKDFHIRLCCINGLHSVRAMVLKTFSLCIKPVSVYTHTLLFGTTILLLQRSGALWA